MSDYLEDAANALHQADRYVSMAAHEQRADLMIRIGGGFARLAAIERHLPPDCPQAGQRERRQG